MNYTDTLVEAIINEAGPSEYDKANVPVRVTYKDGTVKEYPKLSEFPLEVERVENGYSAGINKYICRIGTHEYTSTYNSWHAKSKAHEALVKAIRTGEYPTDWGIVKIERLFPSEAEAIITLSKAELETLSVSELRNKLNLITAEGHGYYKIKLID